MTCNFLICCICPRLRPYKVLHYLFLKGILKDHSWSTTKKPPQYKHIYQISLHFQCLYMLQMIKILSVLFFLLTDSIRFREEAVIEEEVDKFIASWLNWARDRDGGRSESKRAALHTDHIRDSDSSGSIRV